MAKPRKIGNELRAAIEQDLNNGMTRGDACLKHKVSYGQIAAEFGNAWRKKPAIIVEHEVSTTESNG